jgi:hypothetical protein
VPRIAWPELAPGRTGPDSPSTAGARPGFRFASLAFVQSLTTLHDGMKPGGASRRAAQERFEASFSGRRVGGTGEARSAPSV